MSKSLTFISAAGCQLIVLSHPPKKAGWQNNEQMNTQSTVWRNVYPTATSAENKRRISSVDIEINSYFFDIKTKVFNRKTICKCCVRGFVATSLWFYLVGIKHRGEMLNDGVQTQARTKHIVYVLTLKQMYLLVDDTRWSSGIRSSSHCMNFRTNASVTSHTYTHTSQHQHAKNTQWDGTFTGLSPLSTLPRRKKTHSHSHTGNRLYFSR